MPVGERRGRVGSVGIKTGEKGKRWRVGALRNHQSPPWVRVYLDSFFFFFFLEIHSTQERSWGGGGREEERGRQQHGGERGRVERRWRVIYRGGKLPGSERMKREAVRLLINLQII